MPHLTVIKYMCMKSFKKLEIKYIPSVLFMSSIHHSLHRKVTSLVEISDKNFQPNKNLIKMGQMVIEFKM